MNYYNARYLYDINSNIRLANGIRRVINGTVNPMQVTYNAFCDRIIRCIIFGR